MTHVGSAKTDPRTDPITDHDNRGLTSPNMYTADDHAHEPNSRAISFPPHPISTTASYPAKVGLYSAWADVVSTPLRLPPVVQVLDSVTIVRYLVLVNPDSGQGSTPRQAISPSSESMGSTSNITGVKRSQPTRNPASTGVGFQSAAQCPA